MTGISIKPLHLAVLSLGDGNDVQVERIGRGGYTTAWKAADCVYLQTSEKDNSKEILAKLESEHLPKTEGIGWFDGDTPHRLFKQPLSFALLAASKDAWRDYKLLHGMWEDSRHAVNSRVGYACRATASQLNAGLLDMVEGCAGLRQELREAVRLLHDEAGNYGEYCIEITKKNCAVDDVGRLILLD